MCIRDSYRAPLRGAQGNAIKTLIGMPVALGQEHSQLVIESQGQRHTLKAWLSVTGPKLDIQPTAIDATGTRITVMIPGPVDCYHWEPRRWITAYGLFNPHAQLQIRKIDPVFRENSENNEGQHTVSGSFRICHYRPRWNSPTLGESFYPPTTHPPTGITPLSLSIWCMRRPIETLVNRYPTSFKSSEVYPASGGRSFRRFRLRLLENY